MTQLSTVSPGLFARLSICTDQQLISDVLNSYNYSKFLLAFADETKFKLIDSVIESPKIADNPSIVSVPLYGQSITKQISVHNSNDEMVFKLATNAWLEANIKDTRDLVFRFVLVNTRPVSYTSMPLTGLGTVENSQFFWIGSFAGLVHNISLKNVGTIDLKILRKSNIYGPYSNDNSMESYASDYIENLIVFDMKSIFKQNYFLEDYVVPQYAGIQYV